REAAANRQSSVRAVDRQFAQRGQCLAARAQRRKRLVHRAAQPGQARARGLDADQCREGGLVLRDVLAGGLAQGGALALDVEQVVADLEGEAERVGVGVQAEAVI